MKKVFKDTLKPFTKEDLLEGLGEGKPLVVKQSLGEKIGFALGAVIVSLVMLFSLLQALDFLSNF